MPYVSYSNTTHSYTTWTLYKVMLFQRLQKDFSPSKTEKTLKITHLLP